MEQSDPFELPLEDKIHHTGTVPNIIRLPEQSVSMNRNLCTGWVGLRLARVKQKMRR